MTHPLGIETRPRSERSANDATPDLRLDRPHLRFTQVALADQTDRHNELAIPVERLLHPSETHLLSGNLFDIQDTLTGEGWILLKEAPLPAARPLRKEIDIEVVPATEGGYDVFLNKEDGYPFRVLPYEGGRLGRLRALHWHQRQRLRRPLVQQLSNTWGDRNRDSRICEPFLLGEIEAAARLGVDVVQIDDGWQRGVSSNSAQAQKRGGVWEGFYSRDPDFWKVNEMRFPNGLEPVVEAARQRGLGIGLWFAPDSADNFANWERDAATVLELRRAYGVENIKIDSVKFETPEGERNLRRFFDKALDESGGQLVFDFDVTAGVRPGYFGLMDVGPIFVENRYTDWARYWPHHTLRNLWKLAEWIDPMRLRMEWLNPARNQDKYPNDPLAPARHSADYLFATVMFANPLAWFEVSGLPEAALRKAAPLVGIWKQWRERLFAGTIAPVGAAPDGVSWTGFASLGEIDALCLVFRERAAQAAGLFELPFSFDGPAEAQVLASNAKAAAAFTEGSLRVTLDQPLAYAFLRVSKT